MYNNSSLNNLNNMTNSTENIFSNCDNLDDVIRVSEANKQSYDDFLRDNYGKHSDQ